MVVWQRLSHTNTTRGALTEEELGMAKQAQLDEPAYGPGII